MSTAKPFALCLCDLPILHLFTAAKASAMTASPPSPESSSPRNGDQAGAPGVVDSPLDYLGPQDRQLLELGKAEHRGTTAAAKRALKVRGALLAPLPFRLACAAPSAEVRMLEGKSSGHASRTPGTRLHCKETHSLAEFAAAPAHHTSTPALHEKVAEQTADVAQGTLVEMHRQGRQLESAELGMHTVRCGASGRVGAIKRVRARSTEQLRIGSIDPPTSPRSLPPAQVAGEIKEASAILRFMRRWCCLQCCDCLDPTLEQDRTRKQRVAA